MRLKLASLNIDISLNLEPYVGASYRTFEAISSADIVPDLVISIDDEPQSISKRSVCGGSICKFEGNGRNLWGYIYGDDEDEVVPFSYTLNEKNNIEAIIHLPMNLRKYVVIDGVLAVIIGNTLLRKNVVIVHASAVTSDGNAIVFSGRSGIGKSTQALLWEKYLNAEILNHDKPIIYFENGTCYVSGSPWSGSVFCHKNKACPLKAIVFLDQGSSNDLRRMASVVKSLSPLVHNCCTPVLEGADYEYIQNTLVQIALNVPIYQYSCLADKSAVDVLHTEVFGKDKWTYENQQ